MNNIIVNAFSSKRLTAVLLFGLLSLLIAQSPADEANTLPDLGTPEAKTGSLQPNINAQGAGFNYRDNIDGKLISINPQYTEQGGAAIGGSFSTPVSKNMAVGIILTAGSDKNEWLLNTGFDLTSNQRFIFSLGQLRQKLDFNFISGNQKTTVRQDNIAGSYQYFLGKDWLNAAELNAYSSNTGSINLSDKTYFTDTASLFELWSDPRRIAGGRVTGAQGRLVFTPTSKTTIKVGLGAERLTYNYLTGNDSTTRATSSAELAQRLDNDFNFRASANAASSQNRYALGLGKSFKGGAQLGIDVATIKGRDNTFNDNQLLLSYTQSFGGNNASAFGSNPMGSNNLALNNLDASGAPMNQMPDNMATASMETPNANANTWAGSLVEQVSQRPSFLPAQVNAKVDNTATPTRLIAVDKTAIPVGSTIDKATGSITAPTGTNVFRIFSVLKNDVPFINAGQFALSGNTALVINVALITQPAVGVIDTYIVSMNNSSGFGTTDATVKVSHGSTKIDSVEMSIGPEFGYSGELPIPTLSGFSLSASSVAFGATAPTIIAPTSESSGAITYTSSNGAVATITSDGVITLVGLGTATFTATQAANILLNTSTTTTTLTVTAALPAGTVVSGGLTWTRNNSAYINWTTANATCNALTAQGLSAGTWRLPTRIELSALHAASAGLLKTEGWEIFSPTWSSTPSISAGAHYKIYLDDGNFFDDFDYYNAWVTCVH